MTTKFCKKCNAVTERHKNGACKPCRNADCRRWAAKYPEKVKARHIKRYYGNRERELTRAKDYIKRNRDQVLVKKRARYANNAERIKSEARKYYWDNPEAAREAARNWYHANKAKVRVRYRESYKARHRERYSGWTKEMLDGAWRAQRGRCAICRQRLLDHGHYSNSVAADHCHRSGRPRGLLCFFCNTGLGRFKDNTKLMQKAIAYLEKYNA